MKINSKSPSVITEQLGLRLRQARLNTDKTQAEVAELAGLSRKAVLNAEKGQAQLETFVAIMVALNLQDHLDTFLPEPPPSPMQLAKLQGKKRQRASGQRKQHREDDPTW